MSKDITVRMTDEGDLTIDPSYWQTIAEVTQDKLRIAVACSASGTSHLVLLFDSGVQTHGILLTPPHGGRYRNPARLAHDSALALARAVRSLGARVCATALAEATIRALPPRVF